MLRRELSNLAVLQNSLVTFKTLNTARKYYKLKSHEVEGGGEGILKIDSKRGWGCQKGGYLYKWGGSNSKQYFTYFNHGFNGGLDFLRESWLKLKIYKVLWHLISNVFPCERFNKTSLCSKAWFVQSRLFLFDTEENCIAT